MTKKELIDLLADVPDDTEILIPGHSNTTGSYWTASRVEHVEVVSLGDWMGDYQDCDKDNAQNSFAAICIG